MNESTKMVYELAYNTAIQAALESSEIVLKFWPNPLNPYLERTRSLEMTDKLDDGTDYLTVADLESESNIIQTIQRVEAFKRHSIIAEESSPLVADKDWRWFVDPIDGTKDFANGLPDFSVSIGLVHGDEPVVGVIAMPALKLIVAARKGFGTHILDFSKNPLLDLRSLVQNRRRDLNKLLIGYDIGNSDREKNMSRYILPLINKVSATVSYASVTTANFRLAQGLLSGYIGTGLTRFDIGAVATIIPEAGGVFTDIQGNNINWNSVSQNILVGYSPEIHSQLLRLIQ